jgi:hypothetical protein
MIHTEYTLPEFCFLDGNSPKGDTLDTRTVIQHIRSYTIMEAVALDEVILSEFTQPTFYFEYKNFAGVTEKHLLVLHFSLAEEEMLTEIFQKTSQWYCEYMNWEDKNIINDATGANN